MNHITFWSRLTNHMIRFCNDQVNIWYLVVKIVAGLLLVRVDTKWPSGGKETKSRLIVKLCFLFDAYKVDWQWILLPQNRSSTIFHSYLVYHKSSIKPPGRFIYFKPIWGRGEGGGLIEMAGLFKLEKTVVKNNNKLKISIALFPDVIKNTLQKFHIKLNTILNGEKVKNNI